jgi:thiol-disulfide isomerase/thioredoxin
MMSLLPNLPFRLFSLFLLVSLSLYGGYEKGANLFKKKCSSCHAGYIDPELLKKNFFQEGNRLLHLRAPTVNMLDHAMRRGPKKIGDLQDKEMRREEIAVYLEDVLTHPDRSESLFSRTLLHYFEKKHPISELGENEYLDLADFFMEYMKYKSIAKAQNKRHLERPEKLRLLLNEAKRSNKYLIVEASSPTCHYCKRMEREVLSDPEVQKLLQKRFILVEVNVKSEALPGRLAKVYRHITPSFFILDSNGTLIGHYPGSWTRKDFLSILKEHLPPKP